MGRSECIRRETIAALIAGNGTQTEVLNELYERMLTTCLGRTITYWASRCDGMPSAF